MVIVGGVVWMGFGVDFDYVDYGFFFLGMIEKFVIV